MVEVGGGAKLTVGLTETSRCELTPAAVGVVVPLATDVV